MEEKLMEVFDFARKSDPDLLRKLYDKLEVVLKERPKLMGNGLRSFLGMEEKPIDKEAILDFFRTANDVSQKNGLGFSIEPVWEKVEEFLRKSILTDIAKEFMKQSGDAQ